MGTSIPKQFLRLKEKTIIEWTIHSLGRVDQIDGIYIGLASSEEYGKWVESIDPKVSGVFIGGKTRSDTVINGIEYMLNRNCSNDDWVLVHDANRPLVTEDEIKRLIVAVGNNPNGGIVSLPIHDTLKSGENDSITGTLEREKCFRALTPQMFKLGILHKALSHCREDGIDITDESQAMEKLGYRPVLVPGSTTNLKVTTPADLTLAEAILDSKCFSNNGSN